jgi:hypothetical protein
MERFDFPLLSLSDPGTRSVEGKVSSTRSTKTATASVYECETKEVINKTKLDRDLLTFAIATK